MLTRTLSILSLIAATCTLSILGCSSAATKSKRDQSHFVARTQEGNNSTDITTSAQTAMEDRSSSMTLHYAAGNCNLAIVEKLILDGYDVNATDSEGLIPLHYAADKGCADVARYLIIKGSGLDTRARGGKGYTPIQYAVEKGHTEIVDLLISSGASIDIKAEGAYSLLMMAIAMEHFEVAKLLLLRGANAREAAEDGQTALHLLIMVRTHDKSSLDLANILLERGANPHIKDMRYGKSPLELASIDDNGPMIELFLSHDSERTNEKEYVSQEISSNQSGSTSLTIETSSSSRFLDNGDETVTDTETGLMWAGRDNGYPITLEEAERYCDDCRKGGFSDWRMPTMDELASIYDESEKGYVPKCAISEWRVYIDPIFKLSCDYYWAAGKFAGPLPNQFSFHYGGMVFSKMPGSFGWYVLPVRDRSGEGPELEDLPEKSP